MDIKNLIKNNQKLLQKLLLHDKKLASIKDGLLRYTGLKKKSREPAVIAAGHQPVFYYPGIMFKNYFIQKIAGEVSGIPVNFIIDSDNAEIEIPVPYKKNEHYYNKSVKLNNYKKSHFAGFSPSKDEVRCFFGKMEECIKSLDNRKIKKTYDEYQKRFFKLFNDNHNFIDSIIELRKEFERSSRIKIIDLKISEISRSPAYYQFAWHIIKNIANFLKIYNEAVEENKKKSYQPVKLLFQEKDIYELPFWYIKNSLRYPVYVKKENTKFSFIADENTVLFFDIRNRPEREIISQLKTDLLLFPRALTVTLMVRVFFCDIFIHGTGGALYDKITDNIIKHFYNLKSAPVYLSITGEVHLPLINKNIAVLEKKQTRIKDMEYNPSKYLKKRLAEKYIKIKKEISIGLASEKDTFKRKKIHKELVKIDRLMKKHLHDQMVSIKKELKQYKNVLNNKKVFLERKYPYFFYPRPRDIFNKKNRPCGLKTSTEIWS